MLKSIRLPEAGPNFTADYRQTPGGKSNVTHISLAG